MVQSSTVRFLVLWCSIWSSHSPTWVGTLSPKNKEWSLAPFYIFLGAYTTPLGDVRNVEPPKPRSKPQPPIPENRAQCSKYRFSVQLLGGCPVQALPDREGVRITGKNRRTHTAQTLPTQSREPKVVTLSERARIAITTVTICSSMRITQSNHTIPRSKPFLHFINHSHSSSAEVLAQGPHWYMR